MCLGIPGQIIAVTDHERMLATVDISGVQREVNVSCIADDAPLEQLVGSWTLVHVGFAMSRIDEEEAAHTLQALHALGEVDEALGLMAASASDPVGPP